MTLQNQKDGQTLVQSDKIEFLKYFFQKFLDINFKKVQHNSVQKRLKFLNHFFKYQKCISTLKTGQNLKMFKF